MPQSEFDKTVAMYTGVLSGKDTNSGDQILVAAGLAGAVGVVVLPGYWKLLALAVPLAIYRIASMA